MIEEQKREYGGFLPLELNPGQEWFTDYEDSLMRFNTVKAAMANALSIIESKVLYIPYYYCPSTIEMLKRTVEEVRFYHIGEDLLPRDIPDQENFVAIVTNYFGILEDQVKRYVQEKKYVTVIIDNAHAFYCPPILKERIWNVYSAKKFFGVPDGAYLISMDIEKEEQKLSFSADYAGYLLKAYEQGTNSVYVEKKQIDQKLTGQFDVMSVLASAILKNVDYRRVLEQRMENFAVYADALNRYNQISITHINAAYHYPILFSNNVDELRKVLIREKIYIPVLWEGADLSEYGNEFEQSLPHRLLALPMDQRYGPKDIAFIVEKVRFYINEYS